MSYRGVARFAIGFTVVVMMCSIPYLGSSALGNFASPGPEVDPKVTPFNPVITPSGFDSNFVIDHDNISLKVRHMPLDRFIQDLADRTMIEVQSYVPLNETFGADFENMPLDKGLKWILREYNNVFMYERGSKGESRISKIIIFSKIGMNGEGSQVPAKAQTYRPNPNRLGYNMPGGQDDAAYTSVNAPVIAQLSQSLAQEKRGDARLKAVEQLGDMKDEMTFIPLIQALYDKDENVSRSAMNALCEIGGNNVAWALKGCLADRDPRVRKIAAEALKKMNVK